MKGSHKHNGYDVVVIEHQGAPIAWDVPMLRQWYTSEAEAHAAIDGRIQEIIREVSDRRRVGML